MDPEQLFRAIPGSLVDRGEGVDEHRWVIRES
jgi:hypothetical protein